MARRKTHPCAAGTAAVLPTCRPSICSISSTVRLCCPPNAEACSDAEVVEENQEEVGEAGIALGRRRGAMPVTSAGQDRKTARPGQVDRPRGQGTPTTPTTPTVTSPS